ncbi:MAG: extracellular solute-binding protein [Gammaproteobacteria bacterium]|nr:extracellular solute-binding protein [Gammaproteobacteria bacterium]
MDKRVLLLCLASTSVWSANPQHALLLQGVPKYGADFKHFEYVEPAATKGGSVRLSALGTFDSLNPFVLKGVAAAGLGNTYETLTQGSDDEPFTEYGLIAESMEVAADDSWVIFNLRPQARFHDGSPITAADVVFSFDTLKSKGQPFFRFYYASVVSGEALGERRVRFNFSAAGNRELPLIMGQLPILSKNHWSAKEFEKTTLTPWVSSGPYRIKSLDPGRSITYELDESYWGRDLPINVGRHNFKTMRYEYYRDATIALEAFKSGNYDLRQENVSKNWATAYGNPALREGLIKKESIAHQIPTGMQGFWFNTRKPLFSDRRVREALSYAFDFEWTNENLFYGAYTRTASYFSNSELASRGVPQGLELQILEPYLGKVPDEVFSKPFEPPVSDGSGNIRRQLRNALSLLKEAGWRVDKETKKLANSQGQVFAFEIMLAQPEFERVVLPFKRNLERLGIEMRVRTVDAAQYEKRLEDYDFDMTISSLGQSLSPGNEQRDYWTSSVADNPGGRNIAGVRDPVVDALVEKLIVARDREQLVAHTRALDRVLLYGHYVIPNWHIRAFRVAYWDKFRRPRIAPKYAFGLDTWWVDEAREAELAKRRQALQGN